MTETTAPTTFEPDWVKLAELVHRLASIYGEGAEWYRADSMEVSSSVIKEYTRQLAEAGYVVVDREDLKAVVSRYYGGWTPGDEEKIKRLADALGR